MSHTYDLKIDGTSRSILLDGTFSISYALNSRNQLAAKLLNATAYRPPVSGVTEFYIDSTRIFGGEIKLPTEKGFGNIGWGTIAPEIAVSSYDEYTDRRYVFEDMPAGTMKSQLTTLVAYLAPYGVTLDPAQDNGPMVPAMPVDGELLRNVLDNLSTVSGRPWEISSGKLLHMLDPVAVAAPFNIVDGDGNVIGDMVVEELDTEFANRVIVRYSGLPHAAYGFLSPSSNFSDGDEVTLGGPTYHFDAVLDNSQAGHVQLGGSVDDSLGKLIAAIMNTGTPGVDYADNTPVNSSATAYIRLPGQLAANAVTPGAAGNNIEVGSTTAVAVWYGEGGIPIATLQNGYDASLSNRAYAENLASQAPPPVGRGLFETVIERPEIIDGTLAQAVADAYLAQMLLQRKEVNYVTRNIGIYPGMVQQITSTVRNLSGYFIVTEVRMYFEQGDTDVSCEVTAIGGTDLPLLWERFARAMFSSPSGGSGGAGSGGGVSITNITGNVAGHYTLASSRSEYVQGTTWLDVGIRVNIDTSVRGNDSGTCIVQLRTTNAGVSVTARLQDVTNNVTAGTSAPVSTLTFSRLEFPVHFSAGLAAYELQLLPSAGGVDVNGMGYVE